MIDTHVDTNSPFLLVINNLVKLFETPFVLWDQGNWVAAVESVLILFLFIYAIRNYKRWSTSVHFRIPRIRRTQKLVPEEDGPVVEKP